MSTAFPIHGYRGRRVQMEANVEEMLAAGLLEHGNQASCRGGAIDISGIAEPSEFARASVAQWWTGSDSSR